MFTLLASAKFKKTKDRVKLPPIDQPESDEAQKRVEEEDEEKKRKEREKELEEDEEAYLKPYDLEHWVRMVDANKTIYYYNTLTGESQWLAVCNVCFHNGEKWCMNCKQSYCDKHYAKKHRNEKDPEHALLRKHKWSKNELALEQEALEQPGDEYCIECNLKPATKLCDTCWDAYCSRCFDLVHHVGQLKQHKGINYRRAKLQWYCVHLPPPASDIYVNGTTGERTYEKPDALMTSMEKILTENFNTHKVAAEEYSKKIEELQFELEKARYERDKLTLENVSLAQQAKSKGNQSSTATSNKLQDNEYRQMILQPNDRRRGEGRNNQIKQLLEQPIPTAQKTDK
jgi:hypothetical protein